MGKIINRKNKAPAKPAEAADLSDVAVAVKPAPKSVARVRTDSEDHLSTYFRDLAVHELLGPEQEREIAQGIEDQEILTWERVFTRADVVEHVVAMVDGKTEQPISYKRLQKAAEPVRAARGKKKDSRLQAGL